MKKLKFSDLSKGLKVTDGSSIGVIDSVEDIHNVNVIFPKGRGLFCLDETCGFYSPLYEVENKINVVIDPHTTIDKFFSVSVGDILNFDVNFDDVFHEEVKAAVNTLKSILQDNWDQTLFLHNFKEELTKKYYKESKYPDFLEEYPTLEDWLSEYNIN